MVETYSNCPCSEGHCKSYTDVSLFPKALPLTLYASDIQIWTKKRQILYPPFLKSSPMHKNAEYIPTPWLMLLLVLRKNCVNQISC